MSNIVNCSNCTTPFNINNYYKCPRCKAKYVEPVLAEIEIEKEELKNLGPSTKIGQGKVAERKGAVPLDSELVAAQNRTTHAVRALAITFVAAPILFLFVGGLIVLAASSGNSALTLTAIILGIFASLWILISSLSELAKSKVN